MNAARKYKFTMEETTAAAFLPTPWYKNRLLLCIPVLGVGAFLGIGNSIGWFGYQVIWRYFSWTNQTLAMIVLWAASLFLLKEKKPIFLLCDYN